MSIPESAFSSSFKGSVLLVDDEPQVLRAMARILSTLAANVETCRTATQAIERVAKGGVEVVVSDISMPGMSGLELLRAIREHDAELPVVLVTGNPALESATQAVEYGAFRYLEKPVDAAELTETVDRALKLYRLAIMKREALDLLGVEARPSDRAGLEATFERALGKLWVAFQPIVRCSDRSVYGYEALLRCDDAAFPGAAQVVDAAARLGWLNRLGRAVRKQAVEEYARADGAPFLFLNLHPQDLADPELLDESTGLGAMADRVVLEITERATLDIDNLRTIVGFLRDMGFRIAIDDLGAGYSGLTSFALLEPEIVKVDMSLVRNIHKSPVKQKLVASMTSLCRDMGHEIVVEGVEQRAELDTLLALGCDLFQGYLFARPDRAFPAPRWSTVPDSGSQHTPSDRSLPGAPGERPRPEELLQSIVPSLIGVIAMAEAAARNPDREDARHAMSSILAAVRGIHRSVVEAADDGSGDWKIGG